jgi:hypothetical protein
VNGWRCARRCSLSGSFIGSDRPLNTVLDLQRMCTEEEMQKVDNCYARTQKYALGGVIGGPLIVGCFRLFVSTPAGSFSEKQYLSDERRNGE